MKDKTIKQEHLILTIGTAMLMMALYWIGNRVLNSPEQLSASINAVQARVGQIETGNEFRDANYQKLSNDVEYIRRVIEEQARRQGIVIGPTLTGEKK